MPARGRFIFGLFAWGDCLFAGKRALLTCWRAAEGIFTGAHARAKAIWGQRANGRSFGGWRSTVVTSSAVHAYNQDGGGGNAIFLAGPRAKGRLALGLVHTWICK